MPSHLPSHPITETPITIRPAVSADAPNLAEIYAESFPQMFRFAFGLPPRESSEILRELYARRLLSLEHFYVAVSTNGVEGFAAFRLGAARESPGVYAYWRALRSCCGPFRSLRALIGCFVLATVFAGRAPRGDVSYLDTLAVRESSRGQGIGESLLIHCFRLSAESGCRLTCLHVMATNEEARRLYEKLGFESRPDERFLPRLINRVLRGRGTILMVRQVVTPHQSA